VATETSPGPATAAATGTPTSTPADDVAAHPAVRRVAQALTERGVEPAIRILPGSAGTAAEAAAQLGIEVGQIANSLVFAVDPPGATSAVLVLTSGRHRVDTGLVAQLLGADRVRRADADLVRAASGFAIGGVAPVGHPRPLPTLVDAALADYDELWAAAGHPYAVFPTTAQGLVDLTGGRVAVVSSQG
jgi:prolyl-tRNA editing enzyme YbaK/EbsC (Cys-tRNA(Pro) deacylase)